MSKNRGVKTRRLLLLSTVSLPPYASPILSAQQVPSDSDSTYQYKVGVLPFVDIAGSGGKDLGAALSRVVQAELIHSTNLLGHVLSIDGNAKPEDVDPEKAVQIGRSSKVDAVLVGTVLEAT